MKGHHQGALKLFLCYPHPDDGKTIKAFKKYCRANWGSWNKCYALAPRDYRPLMLALIKKPKDIRSAFKRIDREVLNFALLAYQSYLFNETLRMIIEDKCPERFTVNYGLGKMTFFTTVPRNSRLDEMQIPMINHKTPLDNETGIYLRKILLSEGVDQKDFALAKMRFRGVRFKTFMRPVRFLASELFCSQPEHDDRYAGRFKINLQFLLPPGSYATLVLKRILPNTSAG